MFDTGIKRLGPLKKSRTRSVFPFVFWVFSFLLGGASSSYAVEMGICTDAGECTAATVNQISILKLTVKIKNSSLPVVAAQFKLQYKPEEFDIVTSTGGVLPDADNDGFGELQPLGSVGVLVNKVEKVDSDGDFFANILYTAQYGTLTSPSSVSTPVDFVTIYFKAKIAGANLRIEFDPLSSIVETWTDLNGDGQIQTGSGELTVSNSEPTNMYVTSLPTQTFSSGLSMMSFPVTPNKTLSDLFGASLQEFARWNPALATPAYVRYSTSPGDSFLTLDPRKGFWLKLSGEKQISIDGPQATSDVSISLTPGWNMIGTPFNFSVYWPNVKVQKDGVTKYLVEASGEGWTDLTAWNYLNDSTGYKMVHPVIPSPTASQLIEPWKGYWFYSFTNSTLIIPAQPATGKQVSEKPLFMVNETNWTVALSARGENNADTSNIAGVSASLGEIAMPEPPSPPLPSAVSLSFRRGAAYLQAWLFDSAREPLEWTFDVTSQKAEKISLSWDLSRVPQSLEFEIEDLNAKAVVNLRQNSTYTYTCGEEGARSFVLRAKPFSISAFQTSAFNYPNPFSIATGTTFRVQSSVSLVHSGVYIYTMSGKRIRTLEVFSLFGPDTYGFFWDGKTSGGVPVANGVYLYEINATDIFGRTKHFRGKCAVIK